MSANTGKSQKDEPAEPTADNASADDGNEPTTDNAAGPQANGGKTSGPKFEEPAPDPLAGVRRFTNSVWTGMDGKTVSMRTYVGSIIGVIVLMMLARCGG